MTCYEYFECFFEILKVIKELMQKKVNSLNMILDVKKVSEADINSEHVKDLNSFLFALYSVNLDNTPSRIIVPPIQIGLSKYDFPLPKPNEIKQSSVSFLCPSLFSSLSLDAFYEVLCNLYIERCTIFVSSNPNLLTSSM